MAKSQGKKVENAMRLRYIRVLERFMRSISTFLLKSDEVTKEVFDKKIDNNRRYLDRTEPVALYKGELTDLERVVKRMIGLRESDKAIDAIRSELLYEVNQLEKRINDRRYKKDKHTKDKFKDWE